MGTNSLTTFAFIRRNKKKHDIFKQDSKILETLLIFPLISIRGMW